MGLSYSYYLLQKRGTCKNLTTVPPKLPEAGNCVPCGAWHSIPLSRHAAVAAIQDADRSENAEAMKTKLRTYRSVASMCSYAWL